MDEQECSDDFSRNLQGFPELCGVQIGKNYENRLKQIISENS